jgi:serine/threonine protein kinase
VWGKRREEIKGSLVFSKRTTFLQFAVGSLDKLSYDTKEHISNEKKIEWIHEIANGMCHLHKHNIVHRV